MRPVRRVPRGVSSRDAGIAVPAMPPRMASAIWASLRSACQANDDSSRGSRDRLALIGPFDAPPTPWQDAHRCSHTPSPTAMPPASGPRSPFNHATMLQRSSARQRLAPRHHGRPGNADGDDPVHQRRRNVAHHARRCLTPAAAGTMPLPAGPSPWPRGPWQEAQCCWYRRSPASEVDGLRGQLERRIGA